MQEVDHVPRLVHDEHVLHVGREVQPARQQRRRDHHVRHLLQVVHRPLPRRPRRPLLCLPRRSCSCSRSGARVADAEEAVEVVVRAALARVARAGQRDVRDALLREVRAQALDAGALVAENEHLRLLPPPSAHLRVLHVVEPHAPQAVLDVRVAVPARPAEVLRLERRGQAVQVGRGEARQGRVELVEVDRERGGDRRGREHEVERVLDGRLQALQREVQVRVEGDRMAARGGDLSEDRPRRLLEVRVYE